VTHILLTTGPKGSPHKVIRSTDGILVDPYTPPVPPTDLEALSMVLPVKSGEWEYRKDRNRGVYLRAKLDAPPVFNGSWDRSSTISSIELLQIPQIQDLVQAYREKLETENYGQSRVYHMTGGTEDWSLVVHETVDEIWKMLRAPTPKPSRSVKPL